VKISPENREIIHIIRTIKDKIVRVVAVKSIHQVFKNEFVYQDANNETESTTKYKEKAKSIQIAVRQHIPSVASLIEEFVCSCCSIKIND